MLDEKFKSTKCAVNMFAKRCPKPILFSLIEFVDLDVSY